MAPLPHDNASRLEAGQLEQSKGMGEKDSLAHSDNLRTTTPHTGDRRPTARMSSVGRVLMMLLVSFLVTIGVASALSPGSWQRQPNLREVAAVGEANGGDQTSFESLVESASPSSLHELLHKYFPDRFKHGVWESDASAVEAVRRSNEALAVNIVQMAKRQDNGTTTATPESTPTPTPTPSTTDVTTAPSTTAPETSAPETTAPDTTVPNTTAPETTAPGTTASDTTAPPATTTRNTTPSSQTSATNAASSSNGNPSTTTRRDTSTGMSTTSGVPVSQPSSSSSRTSTPTSPSSAIGTPTTGFASTSRPGLSSTSRRQGGSTTITDRPTSRTSFTSVPSVKPVTSTYTSTNANGGVVIVTATSFVAADPQETEASTSTKPTPGLQNAAAGRQGNRVGTIGAGIVLGAALFI